ncbi:MAG TPA: UPF0175 family protein [Bryobacteraceae bacterium]
MKITIEIPDELLKELVTEGQDPSRAVLEAVALEGYRSDRLSEEEVRRLLGFETRYEVDGFLKEHHANPHYTLEDLENDLEMARQDAQRIREERRRSGAERLAG